MRAVVDTNILVSALLRSSNPPAAVILAIAERRLTPVLCQPIVAEYAQVLRRPRFSFAAGDVDLLLALMTQQAVWVDVPAYPGEPALPDPKDWPLFACALAVECPLITGNAKHFPARLGIQVWTARQWLDQDIKALAPE